MSYEAYRGLLTTMTKAELDLEIVRLEGALTQCKTDKGREAWRRMLSHARTQEARNNAKAG